jgi:hypothetical protein
MGQIILRTLDDYARWGCNIRIVCNVCGHCTIFGAREVGYYFRERRWSNDLDLAKVRFRCDQRYGGCGAKDSTISPDPKNRKDGLPGPWPHPMHPDTPPCPDGIDKAAWAKASESERKRLLRQARG